MKIIRHGRTKSGPIQFECPSCGCKFIAAEDEYWPARSTVSDKRWFVTECPECQHENRLCYRLPWDSRAAEESGSDLLRKFIEQTTG